MGIKKTLKKVAKVAIPVLAAVAAAKGVRKGLKKRALNKITDFGTDTGTGRFNQAETWDLPVPKVKTPKFKYGPDDIDPGPTLAAKGGRIGAKKGGRVTGCAKRGFGRALKRK